MFRRIQQLVEWYRNWRWRRRPGRREFYREALCIDSSVDPNPAVAGGRVVLIGPRERPKWVRFQCPCRCGETIALNLMSSHNPHWSVELHDDGTVTVHPSVDAKSCGSHFWVRRGKVQWA